MWNGSAEAFGALQRKVDGSRRFGLRLDGPRARRHRAATIGDGPELAIFSHGFGTDQSVWSGICPQLTDRLTCILYDLPGAGPLLPDVFDVADYGSISRYADDLLALLDEMAVERCIFSGHSVSAMAGVLASIEAPHRFSQLVLLNASPRYLNDDDYHGGFEPHDLDQLFDAMAGNYQDWVAGFSPAAIPGDVPGAVGAFAAGLLAMRPDVALGIARMIFESDLRVFLPQVSVSTLLLHADADIAVPAEVADYLRTSIPGARLVRMAAAGHLPHLSAPHIVAAAMRAHLR